MIEQTMIFALGFCIAGLLALLCLPAISRRALRMAQTAVERQMPISVEEIVAQRDLLRAEFATERRRLEQTLAQTRDAQARDMSEAGRRTAEIGRLGAELAVASGAYESAETARGSAERLSNETTAENAALQKALFDSDGMELRLREALTMRAREYEALTRADAEKQGALGALRIECDDGAEARDQLDRALMQAKLDLSVSRAREETLSAQIDRHEDVARTALASDEELRRKIEDHERRSVGDMDMLRHTIVEIGREVVRMAEDTPLVAGARSESRSSEPVR